MRYDNIIIGGGLSGLIAGIESAKSGRKTAIVSAGQSALHFWSGSFELLGHVGEADVIDSPLSRIDTLPALHPYRLLGAEKIRSYADRVAALLSEAGIKVSGSCDRNHYRLTPLGFMKPAWLSLQDYLVLDSPEDVKGEKFCIVNIYSFIDFYPRFLAHSLRKYGAECREATIDIPQLATLRKSATEMRATNISRFLHNDAVDTLADAINKVTREGEEVIMPAVLGMFSDAPVERLRSKVKNPIYFMATTPASVPGVRCQLALRDRFISLGGTFLPGDTVVKGEFEDNRLRKIYTENFGDMPLEADNFVISTGSFFGHGLLATLNEITEPIFGLDLQVDEGRSNWYRKNVYDAQPYMQYGVTTDSRFRPSVKGRTIENLYATGALLSGFNALKEGSGAGITIVTALSAADHITA